MRLYACCLLPVHISFVSHSIATGRFRIVFLELVRGACMQNTCGKLQRKHQNNNKKVKPIDEARKNNDQIDVKLVDSTMCCVHISLLSSTFSIPCGFHLLGLHVSLCGHFNVDVFFPSHFDTLTSLTLYVRVQHLIWNRNSCRTNETKRNEKKRKRRGKKQYGADCSYKHSIN